MTKYVLVAPDDTLGQTRDEARLDLTAGTRDGYRWLPIENVVDESGYTPGNEFVKSERADPYQVVEADRVTRTTIKRDMTQAEIDGFWSSQFDGMDPMQNRAIFALFKICWALWSQGGGTKQQLLDAIANSPVTAQDVKNGILR